MDHVKGLLLVLLAVSVLVTPVSAGLLEDVDALTPEQALELEKKLEQKKFEAHTKDAGFSGFMMFIDPKQFNNNFPGVPPLTNLYGASFDLRYPLHKMFLMGWSFSGAGNYVFNESSPKVYEDLLLAYGNVQFVLELRLIKTENFILSTSAGAGGLLGFYNYSKTDDNLMTYYNTNRWGTGLSTSLSLDLCWNLQNGWGLGMGLGYFSGRLDNAHKIFSGVDASAPMVDLTGTTFKIFGRREF